MKPIAAAIAAGISMTLFSLAPRAQDKTRPGSEAGEIGRQIQALHWIHGPKHVHDL